MQSWNQLVPKLTSESRYSPKRTHSKAQGRSLFRSYMQALEKWLHELPDELRVRQDGETKPVPHLYCMEMVHHTCIILLAKPFTLVNSNGTPASDSSRQQDSSSGFTGMAADTCVRAAKKTCFLGKKYREAFGNCRRAPLTTTHCTLSAALILLHARRAKNDQLTESDHGSVLSCVTILQELSVSWTPPRRYWRSLMAMIETQRAVAHTIIPKEHCPASLDRPAATDVECHRSSQSHPESTPSLLEGARICDMNGMQTSPGDLSLMDMVTEPPEVHYDQFILDMPFWTGIQADLDPNIWAWDLPAGMGDTSMS